MNATDIYEFIPQLTKNLNALRGCLKKAAAHADAKKFDASNFFEMKLAPDQFNLGKQIQISTDNAKGLFARLSGQTPPVFEDKEKTIAEFEARIDKTLKFLEGFKPSDFEAWQTKKATFPWYPGKMLDAKDYVYSYALPNFYFHTAMAYAIFRENGVDVGKSDFLGQLNWKDA